MFESQQTSHLEKEHHQDEQKILWEGK